MSALTAPRIVREGPDTSELEAEINPLIVRAKNIVIDSPQACEDAAGFLRDLKTARNKIQEWFAPLVEAAHKAHKALTNRRGEVDLPLATAESTVKNKLQVYHTAQERIRKAEEDRLRREAEERERQRVAEENARLDQERLAREAAALEEATRLEAAGQNEAADAVLTTAVNEPAPPPVQYVEPAPVFVPRTVPKTPGVTFKETWDFEVEDFAKLPDNLKLPNLPEIRRRVQSLRGNHQIPGVRAFPVTGVSASGR